MSQIFHTLQSTENLAIWPIISLLIFFTFFSTMLWRTWKMDNKEIDELSKMPLQDDHHIEIK